MKGMIKYPALITLICVAVLTFTSCSVIIRPIKINKIKKNSGSEFLGHEVIIEGIVKDIVLDIPELKDFDASFIIDDGSGTMIVLDKGAPPAIATRLSVKGNVKRVIMNQTDDLALEKMEIVPPYMPDIRDWVLVIAILLIGYLVIMWGFKVVVFKCALTVNKNPDESRNLSNTLSYAIFFVLFIMTVLFLFKGYSIIPIYLLLIFGLVMVLSILILYATSSSRRTS